MSRSPDGVPNKYSASIDSGTRSLARIAPRSRERKHMQPFGALLQRTHNLGHRKADR